MVARLAHNQEVIGSTPISATFPKPAPEVGLVYHGEMSLSHYERNKDVYKARARTHTVKQRKILREAISAAKNVPCVDCNRRFPVICMDFDHLENKKFNIADMPRSVVSLKTLMAEIEKCDVVCACCHRVRTHV